MRSDLTPGGRKVILAGFAKTLQGVVKPGLHGPEGDVEQVGYCLQ
jgi:hypothetical protein